MYGQLNIEEETSKTGKRGKKILGQEMNILNTELEEISRNEDSERGKIS